MFDNAIDVLAFDWVEIRTITDLLVTGLYIECCISYHSLLRHSRTDNDG